MWFWRFVFLRIDLENNILFIYDTGINSEELKKIPVSKTVTVGDYQKARKRPHMRIIETIIEARRLEIAVIFNIRRCLVENVEKRMKGRARVWIILFILL